MLSDKIRDFYCDLKRNPQNYNMQEVIDMLISFEDYAIYLEEKTEELEEKLEQYEEED